MPLTRKPRFAPADHLTHQSARQITNPLGATCLGSYPRATALAVLAGVVVAVPAATGAPVRATYHIGTGCKPSGVIMKERPMCVIRAPFTLYGKTPRVASVSPINWLRIYIPTSTRLHISLTTVGRFPRTDFVTAGFDSYPDGGEAVNAGCDVAVPYFRGITFPSTCTTTTAANVSDYTFDLGAPCTSLVCWHGGPPPVLSYKLVVTASPRTPAPPASWCTHRVRCLTIRKPKR